MERRSPGSQESDAKRERPGPPLSCQSTQSNISKDWGANFKRECPGPSLSAQSMQSDESKDWGPDFKRMKEETLGLRMESRSGPRSGPSCESLRSKALSINFKRDSQLSGPSLSAQSMQSNEPKDWGLLFKDDTFEDTGEESCPQPQDGAAPSAHPQERPRVCRDDLKGHLQKKYSLVLEGVVKAGDSTPLNQIYTEVYIIEGETSEVNQEHEVSHMEAMSRRPAAPETSITCEEIFKQQPEAEKPIRTVLTKGVAGVGKTVLTQKFSLDWAEGRANQDIQLLFPFTFRELNVLKDSSFSLVQLIHHFFSQTKDLCSFEGLQVLFIFDGLDECRLPLDFTQTKALTDPTESASVEELLVNLIRGDLLPSARLWITTRPAAANQIPAECVSMVTEVRGFSDEQKEQYFMKRVSDEQRATALISHIKKSRSLFIMCHLPVFCWMVVTVLLHVMKTGVQQLLPQTMTELYIHFLVVQAKVRNIKYHDASGADLHWTPETNEMVRCLGKLAFEQLQKGNLIFYESDLRECGLDAAEIARYSGVFTQVFREEPGLYRDKVYCFIHLSVQEFLAALHVHQTFYSSGENLLSVPEDEDEDMEESVFKESQWKFYLSAIVQARKSPNGHLDLFLRFLMGLSLPTNQSLLSGLLTPTGSSSLTTEEIAGVIKQWLEDDALTAESRMNLLHCLNELKDHSLMEQVQQSMRKGRFSDEDWYFSQWLAVAFLVLSSDSDLEEFDLRKYSSSPWALLGLLPLIKASTKAILSGGDLGRCDLSSVLSSSSLTDLDLSHCRLEDCDVRELYAGLKSAPCKLQTLSLSWCELSDDHCAVLASACSSSSLKHLDLSNNDLQDSGVELLCEALKSAPCRLEVLRLSGCLVSERGGASLASALSSAHCCLTELDLSFNHPGSSTELLTAAQDDPHCPLQAVRLDPAGEQWMVPGPRKYRCEVLLDPNTANNSLELSEDLLSVAKVEELQLYPSHEERFSSYSQVLSSTALSDRCYWEVERSGDVDIAVSLRGIRRHSEESRFGDNDQSWSLRIRGDKWFVCHRKREKEVCFGSDSDGVGVFLDSEAGALTFYEVYGGELYHLHSFSCSVTEPLFVGFGLERPGSSVFLLDPTKNSTSFF